MLIFADDRAQHRIRAPNKQKQILTCLLQRAFLRRGGLLSQETAEFRQFARAWKLDVQEFVKVSFAFRKREEPVILCIA